MTEKEKGDFVRGKFLTCIVSFSIFKKGEQYWLEYIGKDTYCGRSDNILGQEVKIEPYQLNFLIEDFIKPNQLNYFVEHI